MRFLALYFGASYIFLAILLFDVAQFWRAFHILGKADAKDFVVLVFTGNAHFWSRDSAPSMAVEEKHRIYNK